jgi:LuxR family maltose regulon positive regulatory protein
MRRAPEEIFKTNHRITPTYGRIYASLGMFDDGEALLRPEVERLEKKIALAAGPLDTVYWSLSSVLIGLANILSRKSLFTGNYDFAQFYQRGAHYAELGGLRLKPPLTVANLDCYACRVGSHERGEIEKYIRALDDSFPCLEKCLSGCNLGGSDLARGELAYFRGDLPAAEENLLKAANTAGKYFQYEIELRALFYLSRLYINQGNYQKIMIIREQFKTFLDKQDFNNRQTFFDVDSGWLRIHLGCPELIAGWLKNDFEVGDRYSRVYGMEALVKAKYHFAMREYPAALAVLKAAIFRLGLYVLGKVEIRAMEAVCYHKMGRLQESFACLDAAWEAAAPNGFYMPFIELGKDMRALTKDALEAGTTKIDKKELEKIHLMSSAYSKRLSLAAKEYQSRNRRQSTEYSVQELSLREHTILVGLSHGLTGEEIAAENELSINTVKSIIKRIYVKLGAVNRVDALRIAADLGLLTERK